MIAYKALILLAALGLATDDGFAAPNCQAGPVCKAKGARMNSYIQGAQQKFLSTGGGADAAIGAWCVNLAQAEIANICGNELASMGNQSCADLAYQQRDENKRVAAGSLVAAKAAAPSGNFSRKKLCGF